jgi:hypothetical protein
MKSENNFSFFLENSSGMFRPERMKDTEIEIPTRK